MDTDRLAQIDLAECPMCGSEKVCLDEIKETEHVQFQAWCDDCQVSGPCKDTPEEAANAWSKRALSPRLVNAERLAEAGELCFEVLASALADQRVVAALEEEPHKAPTIHESRLRDAGERVQESGAALRAFRSLLDDLNDGKKLKSSHAEREAALHTLLEETNLMLMDAYGAYVEGSKLFRDRVEEAIAGALLDESLLEEGAGHLIRAAEEAWAQQAKNDAELPLWSELTLKAKNDLVLTAMTSKHFDRLTKAPDWNPMPAPKDVEILVLHTDGSLDLIPAEDNDFDWKDSYDDFPGTAPMLWIATEDLCVEVELETTKEPEMA